MNPVILVHGGAWDIPDDVVEDHKKGCEFAMKEGYEILKNGGCALDAVEMAVRSMEDDSTFDAGTGAFLNSDGEVELDAIIMDHDFNVGGVAAVRNIKNPVILARKVMEETEHILLVGEGANRFAKKIGIQECSPEDLLVGRELERWRRIKRDKKFRVRKVFSGTVGAVAMDIKGRLAVATSTGGTPKKLAGRVGDTPLVGCGAYVDKDLGACSATGWGESLVKVLISKTVVDFLDEMNAQEAADAAIKVLEQKVSGLGGVIVLDVRGNFGVSFNTPRMAHGICDGKIKIGI